MIFIKGWYHLISIIKYIIYKTIYGTKLDIGKKVTWRRGFMIMKDRDAVIRIGDNCFFNNDCTIAANVLVEIGNGSLFGENVKIYDHNHRFKESIPIKNQGFSNGTVHIGNHCWIGSNVVILKGANISDNCVIGAGSVISGFIPEGSIVKLSSKYEVSNIIK